MAFVNSIPRLLFSIKLLFWINRKSISVVKSRFYSDEDYGNQLKSMGDKFTNLKF